MEKYFKVIYKDFEKRNQPSSYLRDQEIKGSEFWAEVIAETIIPWGTEPYDDKVSYRDNLAAMALGIYDQGFVEVQDNKIVPAGCILQILGHQVQQAQGEQSKDKQQNQQNQQRNGNYRRHNKYRKMRPQHSQEAPQKPIPPPNRLIKESEDGNESLPQNLDPDANESPQ